MWRLLTTTALLLALALLAKVLFAMINEYRWYFPPNFDALFLQGREASFRGIYRGAFYTHILSGPLTIVIGVYLLFSGMWAGRNEVASGRRLMALHRRLGWVQFALVVFALVPSGLLMSPYAYAGATAAAGFFALSLMTACSAILALFYALQIQRCGLSKHRRWASRCLILLSSAVWLRIIGGLAASGGVESEAVYRLNAWLSWLLPLGIYELAWRYRSWLKWLQLFG